MGLYSIFNYSGWSWEWWFFENWTL